MSVGNVPTNLSKLDSIQTVEQIVYQRLKKAILAGSLKPGQRLVGDKIADELGVSRMPVRAALRQLEAEGFVVNEPYKGTMVTELSWRNIEEIYDIRIVLEGYAMKLIVDRVSNEQIRELEQILEAAREKAQENDIEEVQNLDDQFHRKLFAMCDAAKLTELITNLWEQCSFYRSMASILRKSPAQALEQHKQILEALKSRDAGRAVQAVQYHDSASRDNLISFLRDGMKRPGGTAPDDEV